LLYKPNTIAFVLVIWTNVSSYLYPRLSWMKFDIISSYFFKGHAFLY
jgi:hypothetical protein